MPTPFRVSLVTACCVFAVVLLIGLFHHDTIGGHVLTPMEELPTALVVAVLVSALGLLGTWLGLRNSCVQRSTYRAGLAVAVLYGGASFVANATIDTGPQTVTFPSHEANMMGLEVLLIATLWGIGAPYAIALIVSRVKLFGKSNEA
jgi:hypothetical protein